MKAAVVAALVAGLVSATPAWSAPERHITVTVELSGTDDTAQQLAFAVKERFRASPLFKMSAPGERGGYYVHLNVMRGDAPVDHMMVYSVTISASDFLSVIYGHPNDQEVFVTDKVGYCGDGTVERCADMIFRGAGASIEEHSDAWGAALAAANKK